MQELDFANGLLARGMYDLAIEQYSDFLERYPESEFAASARFRKAKSYFFLREYREAESAFSDFLSLHPTSEHAPEAKLRIAQCRYFFGDLEEAGEMLSGVVGELAGTELGSLAEYYMASTEFQLGRPESAAEIAGRALERYGRSGFGVYLQMLLADIARIHGETDKALAYYGEVAGMDTDRSITDRALIRIAQVHRDAGEIEKAAEYLERVLSDGESPVLSEAVLAMASMEFDRGRHGHVLSIAEEYEDRVDTVTRGQLISMVGGSYFQIGDHETAVPYFARLWAGDFPQELRERGLINQLTAYLRMGRSENVLELVSGLEETERPGEALSENAALRVRQIKARAMADIGDTEGALESYEGIYEEFPDSSIARDALWESVLLLEGSGRTSEAIAVADIFLRRYPDDERMSAVMRKKAELYANEEAYEKAREVHSRLIEKLPGTEEAYLSLYHIARLHFLEGSYPPAARLAGEVVQALSGTDLAAHAEYLRGRALEMDGDIDGAIDVYRALVRDKDVIVHDNALQQLAFAYYQQGRFEEAAQSYHELIFSAEDPALIAADIYLWTAEQLLNSGEPHGTGEVLNMLGEAHPGRERTPEFQFLFAESNKRAGRLDEARLAYGKVTELADEDDPYYQRGLLGLARVADLAGEEKDVLEGYDRALKAGDDAYTALRGRYYRALLNHNKGDHSVAAREFMMVAILFQDEELVPQALFNAARAFEMIGDHEKASEAISELMRRFPDSEQASEAEALSPGERHAR